MRGAVGNLADGLHSEVCLAVEGCDAAASGNRFIDEEERRGDLGPQKLHEGPRGLLPVLAAVCR